MPIGVLSNVGAVVVGGLLGSVFGKKLSAELKEKLNLAFGISAMGLGIPTIINMKNMSAVVLAMILGIITGVTLKLGSRIDKAGRAAAKLFPTEGIDYSLLVTSIVLFCVSGTGIYGAMVSGMTGDHSILIAKSILDLFTALIFACNLGTVTALIGIPQLIIFSALFFSAKLIYPLTTPDMIADFKACGGLIMLATGFRIAKIREFPIADMIPALLLVWPISYAWTAFIAPLL